MKSDFESLVGWIPDASTVAKDKAHSGQYSIKVDQNHEYGLGYTSLLGQLSSTRIRGVKLDAWVYLTDKDAVGSKLTFILKDAASGQELLGNRIELAEQVKDYGKWVKFSKEINFPTSANYTSQVLVYLWRGGASKPTYIDDIQLTALR